MWVSRCLSAKIARLTLFLCLLKTRQVIKRLLISGKIYQSTDIMQAKKHNLLLLWQDMKKKHYGEYLRELRLDAGLTQVELAARLKVAQSNIAFWERSNRPPRSEILKPLAKALNVTLDKILDVEPFEPTRPPVKGKLAKAFGKASSLSRRQQEKIAEVVEALASQATN